MLLYFRRLLTTCNQNISFCEQFVEVIGATLLTSPKLVTLVFNWTASVFSVTRHF